MDDIEYISECPNCALSIDPAAVLPSCHECECCFCSIECRTEYHLFHKVDHDYKKPFED